MEAGILRHRITIDEKVSAQDETGDPVVTWVPWAVGIPAAVEPLSGKEFMGQNQILGQLSARITIRWRPGLTPTMRIRHGTTIYNIAGVLPDKNSGLDFITFPVSTGTNQG